MEGTEEISTNLHESNYKNEKGVSFIPSNYLPIITNVRPISEMNSMDNLDSNRSFETTPTSSNSLVSSPSSVSVNNSIECKNENRWRSKRASFPRLHLYLQMSKGKSYSPERPAWKSGDSLEVSTESFKYPSPGSSKCMPDLDCNYLSERPAPGLVKSYSFNTFSSYRRKMSLDNAALAASTRHISPRQKFTRALAGASSFRMQSTLDVSLGKPEPGPFSKLNNQKLDDQPKIPDNPFARPPPKEGFLKTLMSFDRLQCITMLCILTVTFCSYCGCSILAPFFPKKIEEKGLSELQSGFVFSAYSGVSILCSPFLGKLVPKFGAKNMILLGIVIGGLSNLAFGIFGDIENPTVFLWLSLLSRATESIGTSFHSCGAYTYVIKLFPNCIGFAFGLTECAIGVALCLGPVFGTFLFMLGGYKTPFFVFGAILIMLCFPMNWFFLVELDEIPEMDDASSSSDSETEAVKATYDGMLKIPQISVICTIIVAMALAMSFLEPTFEPHMRKTYGASEATVGWEFAISSLAYALSTPAVGYATSQFRNKFTIMLIGVLITLAGLLIIGPSPLILLPSNFYTSSLGMICISFGHGLAFIPTFECMLDYCTKAGFKNDMKTHGKISGLWSCLFSVGEFIGPMLAGSIVSKFGFQTVSTIIGMFTFITKADEPEMGQISKEDFLKALEQINEPNSTHTPPNLTPISGQIFFGTDFTSLVNLPPNADQTNANGSAVHTPNTPISPNNTQKTTTSSNADSDLYSDAAIVFDNPCFENDGHHDLKLKLVYRNQKRPNSFTHHHHHQSERSPKKVVSEVPVLSPKARRASSLFPSYLRRTDNQHVQPNNQNLLKDQDPNDPKVTELMTAYSTRILEPYNGINLSEQPRIENYISNIDNIDNNDFINFGNALSKETRRATDFEPPCLNYDKEEQTGISKVKFGWFEGVFIRTSVNLLGVMLFMRMGWMSAQCGILLALLQIAVATIITMCTTLSMNALVTNGDIGAGGIYSMISRSLGPEAGANIGFLFSFTNAAFVGLNLCGAADAVLQIFNYFKIGLFENPLNDIRFFAFIFLIVIALIPIISLQLEAKTQTFFFILILICILDYFIGAVLPPTEDQRKRGFYGFHTWVAESNLYPKFVNSESFWSIFGVFFPSVTPIFTGACMSGDLKDPADAIPKGTFLSIIFTSLIYALFVVITGCTIVSYSNGNETEIITEYCPPNECKFGLINDYNSVSLSSGLAHFGLYDIEPFIYTGILAATLSSALGCYMAAPRIFQSFAEDKIAGSLVNWFAKGYGPANDPRRGYLLTLVIAAIFLLLGDLNSIAVWISNFYLGCYVIVNITTFHSDWVKLPNFRPSFRWYNKWISLVTGLLCALLMFLLDYVSGIFSACMMLIIYYFIKKKSPKVNWGTTAEASLFNLAHSSALKWDHTSDHIKNYRPRIVCLTGNPSARTALLDMAFAITRDYGLLFALHLKKESITADQRMKAENSQKMWLYNRKIRGFYALAESQSLSAGVKQIVPVMGLGKLKPNIVMLGYKSNWQECSENDLRDYHSTIMNVLEQRCTLIIFRLQEGFDFSDYLKLNEEQEDNNRNYLKVLKEQPDVTTLSMIEESAENTIKSYKDILRNTIDLFTPKENNNGGLYQSGISRSNAQSTASLHSKLHRNNICSFIQQNVNSEIPKAIFRSMNQFQITQKPGVIDIWWLYDTGGICILVGFILRNNHIWRNSKIRVFTVIQNAIDIESMKKNLIELLQKFRIPFSDVQVLTDAAPPMDETKLQFRDVINEWIIDEHSEKAYEDKDEIRMRITKSELVHHKELTNKHIRLRELLLEYSYDANLIVMSMPRPGLDMSVPLYFSWLEMLTQGMPPFLLIRGSQSVLTFYC